MKLSVSWNGDGGASAARRSFRPLKRTVFISYGENARRIGRTRRLPALSGALRAERTPQFARNFRHLQNVGKCTDWLAERGGFEPLVPQLTYARNLRGLGVLFDPNKSVCAGEKFVSQKFGCISALSGSLLYVRMTRLLE
jgi:hypothetical protein